MSENLKTIRELAEELGVSKQAIQYHIKSLTNKTRQTNPRRLFTGGSGAAANPETVKEPTLSIDL